MDTYDWLSLSKTERQSVFLNSITVWLLLSSWRNLKQYTILFAEKLHIESFQNIN